MLFPQIASEAQKYHITMVTEPLPDGVNGLLLSNKNGCVSIASDRLCAYGQEVTHALNIGYYAAILSGAGDLRQFAHDRAYRLLFSDSSDKTAAATVYSGLAASRFD